LRVEVAAGLDELEEGAVADQGVLGPEGLHRHLALPYSLSQPKLGQSRGLPRLTVVAGMSRRRPAG
jgi:hypothetical protein